MKKTFGYNPFLNVGCLSIFLVVVNLALDGKAGWWY